MVNEDPGQPQYEYDWQNPNLKKFDFGRVFSRTFDVLKRDGLRMTILSLILMGLPMFVLGIWPMFMNSGGLLDASSSGDIFDFYGGAVITVILIGVLLVLIASLWLQPALVKIVFASLKNETLPTGTAIRQATRFAFPYLGMTILYLLACMVGFLLFIIPGVFIALGWMLAYQIMILEGEKVTDSFGRAWELSKGHKRWLLLLAIVFGVIGAVIGAILSVPVYLMGDPTLAMLEGASSAYWIVNGIVSALGQVVGVVLGAAWATAAYAEIRQIKEGLDLQNQADIFS